MLQHLNPELSAEIRANAGHLPPWKGDPTGWAIDYSNAPVAYAVNITLVHGAFEWDPAGVYLPTSATKALVVERASGEGETNSRSGVSGFIDVLHHPRLKDEAFDPIRYAVNNELHTECNIDPQTIATIGLQLGPVLRNADISLVLGERFEEERFGGNGVIHVVPVLGVCRGENPPLITPNPEELSGFEWVPLGEVAHRPNLSPGYLDNTLPNALGSFALKESAIKELLGLS